MSSWLQAVRAALAAASSSSSAGGAADGWPLPPRTPPLTLRAEWQQRVGGLVCGLLTPGMPCLWPSTQHPAVVAAAAASCYSPLRVSLALLELSAHAHACVHAPGGPGGAGVVLSLLLGMGVEAIGAVTEPAAQQALQGAVREAPQLEGCVRSGW